MKTVMVMMTLLVVKMMENNYKEKEEGRPYSFAQVSV
jgi:hypothetical protein